MYLFPRSAARDDFTSPERRGGKRNVSAVVFFCFFSLSCVIFQFPPLRLSHFLSLDKSNGSAAGRRRHTVNSICLTSDMDLNGREREHGFPVWHFTPFEIQNESRTQQRRPDRRNTHRVFIDRGREKITAPLSVTGAQFLQRALLPLISLTRTKHRWRNHGWDKREHGGRSDSKEVMERP